MLEYDQPPLGDIAFRATSATLYTSGTELRKYAQDEDDEDRADVMVATADWYEAFALDLAAIHNLPEAEAPTLPTWDFPDDDIPF